MSSSINALAIDDDANNLEVIGRLLQMAGISCTKSQTMQQVQAVLETSIQIDIVFLDLEMPHTDGYQTFQLLRNALGLTVPIVACTVHLNEFLTVRELGFNGFIAKPLDRKHFETKVRQLLRGEQVWDI